jgi:hypothetical protein
LNIVAPLATISVGIVVERCKGAGPWSDFLWRPVSVLTGVPATPPWTKLSDDGERATFYVGAAEIELFRSEASRYRENLMTEAPMLWVALSPTLADPPYLLAGVTADPAEGEGWAGIANDIVESIVMPEAIIETVRQFVSEHHVEETFRKRKRDRADPEALARRAQLDHGDKR